MGRATTPGHIDVGVTGAILVTTGAGPLSFG